MAKTKVKVYECPNCGELYTPKELVEKCQGDVEYARLLILTEKCPNCAGERVEDVSFFSLFD